MEYLDPVSQKSRMVYHKQLLCTVVASPNNLILHISVVIKLLRPVSTRGLG
jgi:hypothetical protein